MDAPPSTPVESRSRHDLARSWIVLAVCLAAPLAAIAWVPEFTTQDGPAHLYNARILNASLWPDSPFAETFEVQWRPLPNWAGHLATMALMSVLPPSVAARTMTGLTLVLFAGSVTWLRWSVAGSKGLATAAVFAVLLALNVTWLLGFTSFLLGAALFPWTLAVWWGGREWFGPLRALGLGGLLILGYFCHPISLGLTIISLVLLTILTPGMDRWRRGAWTAASLAPLVPLGLAYRGMTLSAGAIEPVWQHLGANPWALRSWIAQIGWVDPLSLASKTLIPFRLHSSYSNACLSPVFWTVAAVLVLTFSTGWKRTTDRRGWLAIGILLLLGGLLGPDTLGVKHGHYLPQRVGLLGLVALVPWLNFSAGRWSGRLATACLGYALIAQSAFVWEYALDCRDRLGAFARAEPAIGRGKRVGTLLVGIKGRFRANPIMHADCLFGVEANAILWSNYETSHYYFPVKVRGGVDHPPALAFEEVALLDGVGEGPERARRWAELLDSHGEEIDVILEWNPRGDRSLDPINSRSYDPVYDQGPTRVWTRRNTSTTARGSE